MTALLHGGTAPLAALTTVFTPACPTSWLLTTTKAPSQFPPFPSAGPTACDPPAWSSYLAGEGFQYYSPAICPDGFEVGPNCLVTATTLTSRGFPAVAPDETVAFCVPSGQSCTSDTTDFRGGFWGVGQTATASAAAVTVGPAVQIRWRQADFAVLATHPLTPGLTLHPPASSPSVSSIVAPPGVFVTITGKPTPVLASRSTSRAATPGTTFATAVVASAAGDDTARAQSSDSSTASSASASTSAAATTGLGAADASSQATSTSSPHTSRALIGAITVSSVLGVSALGLGLFVVFARRRQQRRDAAEPHRSSPETGGSGGSGGSRRTGPSALSSAWSKLTAVGLGVWVRRGWSLPQPPFSRRRPFFRRRPKSQTGPAVEKRSLGRDLPSTREPAAMEEARPFEWRLTVATIPELPDLEEASVSASAQAPGPPPSSAPAPAPAPGAALEPPKPIAVGLPIAGHRRSISSTDSLSDMDLEKLKAQAAMAAAEKRALEQQRWSWVSRLSRAMRTSVRSRLTDGSTPSRGYYDVSDNTTSSRPSTRWSRWTRADTEVHSFYAHGDEAGERSWQAFARTQGGISTTARVVVIKKPPEAEAGPGAASGLTVPRKSLLMLSPPTDRTRTSGAKSPRRSQSPQSPSPVDDGRFSRLSDGTFGFLARSDL